MSKVEKIVSEILNNIKNDGIAAVKKYNKQFDKYEGALRVTRKEIEASENISPEVKNAIHKMIKRIEKFHRLETENNIFLTENGSFLGIMVKPINRIGIYVPGGKPLPSSLIMSAIPAIIAGVKEIVVATPPKNNELDKNILYTAKILGITEIYKIGGAHAIGAMAYGAGMKKVDKIVGPGNQFVAEAKRQVFGICGIDKIAGPSEICIIADETANYKLVKSDIEAQLEHGEGTKAYLLTTSTEIYKKIRVRGVIKKIFKTTTECIEESNRIAPEHLEILTKDALSLLSLVENAGAVYFGENTPVAAGDYFIGTNHVLPTGGTARFSSALGVWDFVKRISIANLSRMDYIENRYIGIKMADIEGLEKHKKSLEVRE